MSTESRHPVERIAEEFSIRLRAGEHPSIEEYVDRHPEHAELIRSILPSIAMVERVSDHEGIVRSDDIRRLASQSLKQAEVLGDYEIVREIGRGGMGAVYEALQRSLNRHVALKVISSAISGNEQHSNRFRREAEAAACLHHTNIVPIFGFGQDNGRHYYAMQLIDGETLQTAIQRRLADVTAESDAERMQYYRKVARIVSSAANALDYAHRQRVLHRDIKPANLLLDRQETLWITDFGLARRTDLESETQAGEILGTLRYMAPEQFAGRGDSRSDIYGLGLTLYEMLTLQPAIESPKSRLLDPVRNSIIRNPRSIDYRIPIDLQIIALKACAYAAEDRYQLAADFEKDLLRFLEDRPILAKRSTRIELLARWARRNPLIASLTAATAGLLLLVAGLLGIWNRQQQRAIVEIEKQFARAETNLVEKSKALDQVEQEQTRAEKNFDLAMKAFSEITINIASRGNSLMSLGGMEEEDEFSGFEDAELNQADVALLETLLGFFQRFSEENERDLRIETAIGRQRVGDIQNRLGKMDEAEKSYQKALDAFRSIHRQTPGRSEVVLPILEIHSQRLLLFANRGQLQRVRSEYDDARRLIEQSSDVMKQAEGRFARATLLSNMGAIGARIDEARLKPNRSGLGRFLPSPDQIAKFRSDAKFNAEAISLLIELCAESPDNIQYQVARGRALRDEVRMSLIGKDLAKADESLRKAIELFESLCKSYPESATFQFELADTLTTGVGSRPIDNERCLRALSICEEICKTHPQSPDYQSLRAKTLVKLSKMAGRAPRAIERIEQAIAIQRDLVQSHSNITTYRIGLIQSLRLLSENYEARENYQRAIEAVDAMIQEFTRLKQMGKSPLLFVQAVDNLKGKRASLERKIAENVRSPSK